MGPKFCFHAKPPNGLFEGNLDEPQHSPLPSPHPNTDSIKHLLQAPSLTYLITPSLFFLSVHSRQGHAFRDSVPKGGYMGPPSLPYLTTQSCHAG